ncbi:hypothetical protein [Paratissierella segnis]|uniref:Uncharacterized protein n=1 Tax=Paratissierella segnis TaxID=2763679 RepID=A0A926EUW9_9FIRM|nr:hypothetical protein [Paratissierella segnis]MBC8589361.1 hypothetical protein [Paratissierella segnis]
MEYVSKSDMEITIKYLIEEKSQLERDIRTGEEAKKAIVYTKEKLEKVMSQYLEG